MQSESINSFIRGLFEKEGIEERVPDGALSKLVNVDIDIDGSLKRRPGYSYWTKLIESGSFPYGSIPDVTGKTGFGKKVQLIKHWVDVGGVEYIFIVTDGSLYALTYDGNLNVWSCYNPNKLVYFQSTDRVKFTSYYDKAFFLDKHKNVLTYDAQFFASSGVAQRKFIYFAGDKIYIREGVGYSADTHELTINAVDQGNQEFTVTGNQENKVSVGEKVNVSGSTGNDGTYTVVAVTFSTPDTIIEVNETIPDSTADGIITSNYRILIESNPNNTEGNNIYEGLVNIDFIGAGDVITDPADLQLGYCMRLGNDSAGWFYYVLENGKNQRSTDKCYIIKFNDRMIAQDYVEFNMDADGEVLNFSHEGGNIYLWCKDGEINRINISNLSNTVLDETDGIGSLEGVDIDGGKKQYTIDTTNTGIFVKARQFLPNVVSESMPADFSETSSAIEGRGTEITGTQPVYTYAAHGFIWVLDYGDKTLYKYDPSSYSLLGSVSVPDIVFDDVNGRYARIVASDTYLWVNAADRVSYYVYKINPTTCTITSTIDVYPTSGSYPAIKWYSNATSACTAKDGFYYGAINFLPYGDFTPVRPPGASCLLFSIDEDTDVIHYDNTLGSYLSNLNIEDMTIDSAGTNIYTMFSLFNRVESPPFFVTNYFVSVGIFAYNTSFSAVLVYNGAFSEDPTFTSMIFLNDKLWMSDNTRIKLFNLNTSSFEFNVVYPSHVGQIVSNDNRVWFSLSNMIVGIDKTKLLYTDKVYYKNSVGYGKSFCFSATDLWYINDDANVNYLSISKMLYVHFLDATGKLVRIEDKYVQQNGIFSLQPIQIYGTDIYYGASEVQAVPASDTDLGFIFKKAINGTTLSYFSSDVSARKLLIQGDSNNRWLLANNPDNFGDFDDFRVSNSWDYTAPLFTYNNFFNLVDFNANLLYFIYYKIVNVVDSTDKLQYLGCAKVPWVDLADGTGTLEKGTQLKYQLSFKFYDGRTTMLSLESDIVIIPDTGVADPQPIKVVLTNLNLNNVLGFPIYLLTDVEKIQIYRKQKDVGSTVWTDPLFLADMEKDVNDDWVYNPSSPPYAIETYEDSTQVIAYNPFTQGLSLRYPVNDMLTHKSRLILINPEDEENSNVIYFSSVDMADAIPPGNSRPIESGDGDNLYAGASAQDYLYLFKERHIYAILGDAYDGQLIDINKSIGCKYRDLVVTFNNIVYFLGDTGLYAMQQYQVNDIAKKRLDNYFDRKRNDCIDFGNLERSGFSYFDPDKKEVYFFVPTMVEGNAQTTNNTCIVYNIDYDYLKVYQYHDDIYLTERIKEVDGNVYKVLMTNYDGDIWELTMDKNDDGQPISYVIRTKKINFGTNLVYKIYKLLKVAGEHLDDVRVSYWIDDKQFEGDYLTSHEFGEINNLIINLWGRDKAQSLAIEVSGRARNEKPFEINEIMIGYDRVNRLL